jgi:multidrug resistance efflux pump
MIAFMTIIYVALIVLVFKVFKVKPRPWPIAAFVVAGVLLIGITVVVWTLAAPISQRAVVSRYVVQLVPYVKGQVVSIPARPNTPLKKGDVLYEIDPEPYRFALNQVDSELQAASSNVLQLEAAVRVAEAGFEKAKADAAEAKVGADVAEAVHKENPEAISKLKLGQAEQQYLAAKAGVQQAEETVDQTKLAVTAAKDAIPSVEAQRDTAKFNLQECTVKAPADGFVTDWQIRDGTYVTSIPLAAAGTFIDTSETMIVASFPAEMLIHVEPGQKVEVAFKSRPGVLFLGKVETVIQASGEGQFTTGGKLPSAVVVGSPGLLAVKIRLDDKAAADGLEMGAPGTVAIYTDWGKPFHVISKVTVRMQKWLYFLPIPGK